MHYKMWLDDERLPPANYPGEPPYWQICLNVNQAQKMIMTHGWPCHISFDHDLGPPSAQTGYDLAKWLVDRDLEWGDMPEDFTFAVHSMNPIGAENIGRLMTNYLRHKREQKL